MQLFNDCHDINMDTNRKCSHFIGYYNHMMNKFSHLNPESVVTLFKSYCCSFYGSFLWKYNNGSLGKCGTQWNKCIRRIYSLPYNNNNYILFFSANIQFHRNLFSALYKRRGVQQVLTRTCTLKITYIITIGI